MNKLVTVIIPAYNHEKYITKCINSVLNQTYKNLEVIVEDDYSTDSTKEKIKKINDPRLKKIYSKKNKGVVRTMNELMDMAQGDYIAVIGSDDFWYPDKIEKQMKIFEQNKNLGCVFTGVDFVDENDNKYFEGVENIFPTDNMSQGERIKLFYEKGNHLCHPSSLIPKKVVKEIGHYNCAYRQLHDYDYWTRIIQKYNFYIIDEHLMGYRREKNNQKNISYSSDSNLIRNYNEAIDINYKMIRQMNKKNMIDGFKEFLSRKALNNDTDMECEKFLLFHKIKNLGIDSSALSHKLVFDSNNSEKIINNLEKKYNYNLKKFYEETGKIAEIYPANLLIENNQNLRKLNEMAQINNAEITILREEIDKILNSKSWKITKPLRAITGGFKNGNRKNK